MGGLYPTFVGLPNFFLYTAIAGVLTFVFGVIYVRVTGHEEIALIRQGNASAALAFGGALVGFALPMSKAVAQASSIPDCVVWGVAGLSVQLIAYFATRLLIPDLSKKIEQNTLAVAIILAAIAIAAGLLNSAAMTYVPSTGGLGEAL
jgi:putative membrane protein